MILLRKLLDLFHMLLLLLKGSGIGFQIIPVHKHKIGPVSYTHLDVYKRQALRGGSDIRGALIGPGVHASHGMERTHYDGVENTMKLILAYIS